MVKKKTALRNGRRFNIPTLKNYRNYWPIYVLGVISIIGLGIYSLQPEDLGPQLPPPPADALYKQANQPIDARVQDLLSRMTLEEKIGQMALVDKNSLGRVEDISKYYLGGVLSGAGAKPENNTPQGWLDMVSDMKNQADKSRLGIPILYGIDANHGHANVLGATVFPHAIGLGASHDTELVKEVAAATSEELTATGINWNYSPSLDAPKDMRWGRVYESYSDNPILNGELGSSYISGTQSPKNDKSYVLASAKHYLATGSMVWGDSNHKSFKIDQGRTLPDEEALVKEYLPPYKAAVDAGVASVMVALNQWGDERMIDSKYLVTDKLKNELGFKGFVVSDWYGTYEYSGLNNYESNVKTINAGMDMAMLPYDYKSFMRDVRSAVTNGDIEQARIDDAVGRILHQKFKAGLFDGAPDTTNSLEAVGSNENHKLARRAVASSAVLLKNENSILPLRKDLKRILVAGSGADNVGRQSGAWTVEWQGVDGNWMPGGTSVLQGIRQVASSSSSVDYELNGNFWVRQKAPIGIAVVSEKPYAEGWGDNENPAIDEQDLQAIENLKKSSEKVIVIILSGRPLIISEQIPTWDAAVAAWLPGSEGGGIADVIFGEVDFKAKLPITWPSSLNQIPTNADGTTRNGTKPLFTRGYGL